VQAQAGTEEGATNGDEDKREDQENSVAKKIKNAVGGFVSGWSDKLRGIKASIVPRAC